MNRVDTSIPQMAAADYVLRIQGEDGTIELVTVDCSLFKPESENLLRFLETLALEGLIARGGGSELRRNDQPDTPGAYWSWVVAFDGPNPQSREVDASRQCDCSDEDPFDEIFPAPQHSSTDDVRDHSDLRARMRLWRGDVDGNGPGGAD